jgi:hypothetical protein
MAKYPVAGNSYIEVDDAEGTPRDLSPYLEEIEPLGPEVSFLDVTGLNDTAQRVIAGVQSGREFALRGLFDDTAATGPDRRPFRDRGPNRHCQLRPGGQQLRPAQDYR